MVGGFGLAPLKIEGGFDYFPVTWLWGMPPVYLDRVSVAGGWRCSEMIEFPVRTWGIWVPYGDQETDFAQAVRRDRLFVWAPK
jgi:hypothetical protein